MRPFPNWRDVKRSYFALLIFAAACCGAPAEAQEDVQRIAAVVNDQVVSAFDLSGRIRLTIVSSGLEDTPEIRARLTPQILRTLIDEALEVEEAKRLNITVSTAEIQQALARIAKQNDMTDDQFSAFLKQTGIPLSTVVAQVRAGISWSKIVAQKIRPTIEIGDDQVEEYIDRLKADKDKPEFRLQEIFLSVDSPQQEDEVRRTAERLADQIKRGANFTAVARQFSQSATAAVGGDLGWVEEGALEPELQKAVDQLKVGEISAPIRTVAGYHLILLRDKRKSAGAAPDNTVLKIQHLFIPGPPNAKPDGRPDAKPDGPQTARRPATLEADNHLAPAAPRPRHRPRAEGGGKLPRRRQHYPPTCPTTKGNRPQRGDQCLARRAPLPQHPINPVTEAGEDERFAHPGARHGSR